MLTLSRPSLSGGAPTRARGCSGLAVRDASTPLRVLQGSLLASLKPTDLNMLNQSKCIELKGKSDAKDYAETVQAMDTLGIPKKEQSELFRVLSALLLLGNIKFTDDANDKASQQQWPG